MHPERSTQHRLQQFKSLWQSASETLEQQEDSCPSHTRQQLEKLPKEQQQDSCPSHARQQLEKLPKRRQLLKSKAFGRAPEASNSFVRIAPTKLLGALPLWPARGRRILNIYLFFLKDFIYLYFQKIKKDIIT